MNKTVQSNFSEMPGTGRLLETFEKISDLDV